MLLAGLEPATLGLKGPCTTIVLQQLVSLSNSFEKLKNLSIRNVRCWPVSDSSPRWTLQGLSKWASRISNWAGSSREARTPFSRLKVSCPNHIDDGAIWRDKGERMKDKNFIFYPFFFCFEWVSWVGLEPTLRCRTCFTDKSSCRSRFQPEGNEKIKSKRERINMATMQSLFILYPYSLILLFMPAEGLEPPKTCF